MNKLYTFTNKPIKIKTTTKHYCFVWEVSTVFCWPLGFDLQMSTEKSFQNYHWDPYITIKVLITDTSHFHILCFYYKFLLEIIAFNEKVIIQLPHTQANLKLEKNWASLNYYLVFVKALVFSVFLISFRIFFKF